MMRSAGLFRHRATSLGGIGHVVLASLGLLASPAALAGQGTVAGRVSIQERPGETTTDFSSTVIYLVPADSASAPTRPVRNTIAMNGRAFVPRVRVVTPGSRVEFPNQDPFSHNIFSTAPGAVFDLGLYGSGKSKETAFRRPGAFPIYCNIHPRMTAFIVVAPTPWAVQAGNDGRWAITDVPAGRYVLHAWHERTPAVSVTLDIPAEGIGNVATALDARGFKFAQHKNKFGKEYDKVAKDRY